MPTGVSLSTSESIEVSSRNVSFEFVPTSSNHYFDFYLYTIQVRFKTVMVIIVVMALPTNN